MSKMGEKNTEKNIQKINNCFHLIFILFNFLFFLFQNIFNAFQCVFKCIRCLLLIQAKCISLGGF